MLEIFQTPGKILTGLGCFDQVGKEVAGLGKHCLLVTGEKSMQEQGIFDKAIHLIGKEGCKVTACTGVEHDPSVNTVDRARAVMKKNGCDVVLGLGGGSAIDVAKAAAGLANCDEATLEFFDGKEIPGSGVPVVAAPSTFGTGTEATKVSVLSDHERILKQSIRHDCMLPKVAIVDPIIGADVPPHVTAACGMDALTQGIESYISKHATDMTRAMSFSSIILTITGLPRAFKDGHDIQARENCANGSLMAGIALHNARLGLVHGIAHPLGIHYDIAHGEACGILLPYVLRYNSKAAEDDYQVLASIMAGDPADFCLNLLENLGMPTGLKHIGIKESEFETIAEKSLPSGSTKANPRTVTKEDIIEMLKEMCL
ncbi:MAG: iron-containing alcohol dehydrogenase [Planctomycetes bacterium]|nr:iron-containing alcohol dehydrogenase [Planctomycetota bacterium]